MNKEKNVEDLERELTELKKKQIESSRKDELIREINKLKRGNIEKNLWHLTNGLKLMAKWIMKFFSLTFKVIAGAGKNVQSHQNKPVNKVNKNNQKSKSESYKSNNNSPNRLTFDILGDIK